MERRTFLATGLSALAVMRPDAQSVAQSVAAARSQKQRNATAGYVRGLARQLSRRRFEAPTETLPAALADIGYDEYRELRFRPEKAIWHTEDLGFELQLFPSSYIYRAPVSIYVVEDGRTRRLAPDPSLFDFGALASRIPPKTRLSFSGFRIHAPLNRRDNYDEFLVFQGSSYFRGLGKQHQYGLSARALALDTTGPEPEEFPLFRSFWIERPETRDAIIVHALLDSPSVTGAYTFVIKPGRETLVDTVATLFPRRDLSNVGIAPLTSMFLKNPHDPDGPLDFRPAVHDSDGLAIWNGQDERLWRPLLSPSQFQSSYFRDRDPKGFGLIQRERRFEDYQDLEAHYEQRPSAWITTKAAWGPGCVELVEIPTDVEYVDNIVAYWRPDAPLVAGRSYDVAYELAWCDDVPASDLLRVQKTRIGAGSAPGTMRFVVDFAKQGNTAEKIAGSNTILTDAPPAPDIDVSASAGTVRHATAQANPYLAGMRIVFELDPGDAKVVELRLSLSADGQRTSETWLYRWAPPA